MVKLVVKKKGRETKKEESEGDATSMKINLQ